MSNIDIQALAQKADDSLDGNFSPKEWIERFAAIYRDALFAELLAGSVEPIGEAHTMGGDKSRFTHSVWDSRVIPVGTTIYTADQLAAEKLRGIEQGKRERDAELIAGSGEAVAHIYPSTLEKFSENETFDHCYSVAVGCREERSQPLYTADQLASAVLRERERCAKVADQMDHNGVMIAIDIAAAIRKGEQA